MMYVVTGPDPDGTETVPEDGDAVHRMPVPPEIGDPTLNDQLVFSFTLPNDIVSPVDDFVSGDRPLTVTFHNVPEGNPVCLNCNGRLSVNVVVAVFVPSVAVTVYSPNIPQAGVL